MSTGLSFSGFTGRSSPLRRELDAHFQQLEEAIRRDHRRLGRELGLFTFSDDVGAGIPLFLPKGEIIRYTMEQFVRETQNQCWLSACLDWTPG